MNDGIITENNKEQFKKLFENKNGKMLLDIDEIVLIASKHRSYEMLILGILNQNYPNLICSENSRGIVCIGADFALYYAWIIIVMPPKYHHNITQLCRKIKFALASLFKLKFPMELTIIEHAFDSIKDCNEVRTMVEKLKPIKFDRVCTKVCQHYEQNVIAQNDIILGSTQTVNEPVIDQTEKPNNSELTLHNQIKEHDDNNSPKNEEDIYKKERSEQIKQETKDNCCIIY